MQTDNLLKQVSFIKEIDKLKYIQRKTKLFNSDRNENDPATQSLMTLRFLKKLLKTKNCQKSPDFFREYF